LAISGAAYQAIVFWARGGVLSEKQEEKEKNEH